MRRIFAAIPVSPTPNLERLLRNGQAILERDAIRWTNKDKLHVTLKFFGETSDAAIEEICCRFKDIIAQHRPFQCSIQGLGIFGSRYQPRVIWAGIATDTPLRNMAERLLEEAANLGFPRDRLPFVPHLTMARITSISHKKHLTDWIKHYQNEHIQDLNVENVVLYQSKLLPTGSVHTAIETFPLTS